VGEPCGGCGKCVDVRGAQIRMTGASQEVMHLCVGMNDDEVGHGAHRSTRPRSCPTGVGRVSFSLLDRVSRSSYRDGILALTLL